MPRSKRIGMGASCGKYAIPITMARHTIAEREMYRSFAWHAAQNFVSKIKADAVWRTEHGGEMYADYR